MEKKFENNHILFISDKNVVVLRLVNQLVLIEFCVMIKHGKVSNFKLVLC